MCKLEEMNFVDCVDNFSGGNDYFMDRRAISQHKKVDLVWDHAQERRIYQCSEFIKIAQ